MYVDIRYDSASVAVSISIVYRNVAACPGRLLSFRRSAVSSSFSLASVSVKIHKTRRACPSTTEFVSLFMASAVILLNVDVKM